MRVTITMFNGAEAEYLVDEVSTRDEPSILILHMNKWKVRVVIPFESLIHWKEEANHACLLKTT